jgi:hypothetical protein
MHQSVAGGFIRKTECPVSFSASLGYYIRRKELFLQKTQKTKPLIIFIISFQNIAKLVKTNTKSKKLAWLKSVDDLKTRAAKFWKYVSTFRKIFLKLHTSQFPRMRYKRHKVGCDWSKIKGTLVGEQITFWAVSRFPFEEFS